MGVLHFNFNVEKDFITVTPNPEAIKLGENICDKYHRLKDNISDSKKHLNLRTKKRLPALLWI